MDAADEDILHLAVAALARSLLDVVREHGLPIAPADLGPPIEYALDDPRLRRMLMAALKQEAVYFERLDANGYPEARAGAAQAGRELVAWLEDYVE